MSAQSLFNAGRVQVMGILNVTPDSFSDGGRYADSAAAVESALQMIGEGADILDVGGESTRPGSDGISEDEELRRVLPVVEVLASRVSVPLSIDTCKPGVARRCLAAGARILNDITGLREPEMLAAAAEHGAAVVIMHMRGTPKTMQDNTDYADVVAEVKSYLETQALAAEAAGIRDICIDPGIGFAKSAEHNYQILRRLGELRDLGYPVLAGVSRKSFLSILPGQRSVEDRLEGTLAAVAIAVLNGADIVRVHDVRAAKRAVAVAEQVRNT
jgi:dihydropteroate synthase